MRLLLAGIPLVLAFSLRLATGGAPVFPPDDTYIAIHAAHHLFTGVDPSFPEGAGLVGVTSPLHVMALWMVMRVVSPIWAAEILCWAGAAFYLLAASSFICGRLKSQWERVLAMLVACVAGYTTQHLASGQETAWAMGAIVWSMDTALSDPPKPLRSVLWAALLPWIRPELVLWSLALLWKLRSTKLEWLARALAAVVVSVVCYALVNRIGGGSWLPNTIEAKRVFFAEYNFRTDLNIGFGAYFLGRWFWSFGPAALALAAALSQRSTALPAWIFLAMWVGLSVNGPSAFEHNFFRYGQPFAIAAILAGLSVSRTWLRRTLLLTAAASCLLYVPDRWADYKGAVANIGHARAEIAAWLKANASQGSKVLVHDAGYLSEATNLELVDLVGLKTPSSTKWHERLTGPSRGSRRNEAVQTIACQAAPSFYFAFSMWERAFNLTEALSQSGWMPTPVVRRAVDLQGNQFFTLYKLTIPRGCPPHPASDAQK